MAAQHDVTAARRDWRSMRAAASIALACLVTSCGGEDNPASVGPSSAGHTLNVIQVEGKRWAQSGNYLYSIRYSLRNDSDEPATYSLLDFVLLGPSGETLTGYTSIDIGRTVSLDARRAIEVSTLLNGTDPGHPYAERLQVRVSFRAQNGKQGVLADEDAVLHGPQTARLHDFSMSPPGAEAGSAIPSVQLGEPVTVRWNVEGASLVVLESTLPMPPSGGRLFGEEVEHLGSRTFTTLREGLASATLVIDRGQIRKQLLIGVRR